MAYLGGMASESLHLARDGKEYGTCLPEDVAGRVAAGTVLATDYFWRPGMKEWQRVAGLLAPRQPLPFARPADKDANFLDDLFSRESKVKGLQLLWDKLAASPRECLVAEAEMADITQQVGYDVRQRCKADLKRWYRQALTAYLADRLFTPQEKVNLGNLALSFGLSADEALALHREEFVSYFNVGLKTCLARNVPLEQKVEEYRHLWTDVPLPNAVIDRLACEALAAHMDGLAKAAVVKDDDVDLLDPAKDAEIRQFAKAFGMDIAKNVSNLSARMDRSVELWRLYNAPLTPISSDRELGSEPCYWQRDIKLYQMKRVTVRRGCSGFSTSVRLFGGLRYRVGDYDVQRETAEQMVQVDEGRLLFTASRVIFDGNVKNFNFKHAKVLEVTVYSDAIVIGRDTGPDLICLFPDKQREAAIVLRRLVRQVKG